jgi:hypothetical protein
MLLSNRGYDEAWRLQYLTDLKELPDYEPGWHWDGGAKGAPVDADGNPVLHKVPKSWDAATTDGETWLRECEPPFWGRPGRPRPDLPAHLRRTEADVAAVGGIRPKSSFQVGGAGSVGTGSVRGFPVLARLQDAGYAIWPFDAPACAPVALEIWPRLFTGPVVKSDARARAAHLDVHHPALDRMMRDAAVGSEDAFDAAVSAVVMSRHEAELRALPALDDVDVHLEGCVWQPGVSWSTRRPAGEPPT